MIDTTRLMLQAIEDGAEDIAAKAIRSKQIELSPPPPQWSGGEDASQPKASVKGS